MAGRSRLRSDDGVAWLFDAERIARDMALMARAQHLEDVAEEARLRGLQEWGLLAEWRGRASGIKASPLLPVEPCEELDESWEK
jgi:hypothetical protein